MSKEKKPKKTKKYKAVTADGQELWIEGGIMPVPGPGRNPTSTDAEIISALLKTGGHIANAAKMLGYQPQSLRNKICTNPVLREAKNEIREQKLDQAELKLDQHIYEKDSLPALLEYLKAAGKSRGYGGHNIEMSVNANVKHSVDEEEMNRLIEKFQSSFVDQPKEEEEGDE